MLSATRLAASTAVNRFFAVGFERVVDFATGAVVFQSLAPRIHLIVSLGERRIDVAGQEAEIIATGIPPPEELEAAIVRTLPPAAYTAIVRGVNDTIGVALVEVYALD